MLKYSLRLILLSFTVVFHPSVSADTDEFFPLNIYSYNSKIPLGEVAAYRKDNIQFLGDEDQWVNIRVIGGIPAWLKKEEVQLSSDGQKASVIKQATRLFIKPNNNSRYLMTVKFGHAADVIDDAGEWVQVSTPDTLALKVKKRDYDRIYPRFGTERTNVASDFSIPNAQRPIKRVETSTGTRKSRSTIVYSQNDIQNLPDARIESATVNTTPVYSEPTITQDYNRTQLPTVGVSSYQGSSVYATTGLRDYQLTPGDVVSISVFGEQDMAVRSVKIPVNGFVSFPLVGQVFVAGKTPSEVERSIEGSLAGGFLSDPKVNLSIDVYRPVYVRGAVFSPGSYDFNVGLTVAKLLTTAGGANRDAIKDTVKLYRNNAIYLENLNLDSQELIHPGDIVSVEEKPEEIVIEEVEPEPQYIYLHGEIESPGEYEYRDGLTVEKAIALAGGFGPRASKKRIDISREVIGQEEPEKIKRTKLHFSLLPGDIVHVGESWF